MQQQIGFCSTQDGARIAYATVGTGPALIFAQWASHLELEWEEPRVRDFWETIGHHHTVVRYDKHGCGLSDRNRTDFSLDSEVRTIEAVVKELALKSFVLWGQGGGAAPAIAYAAKSPHRVSHLILSNTEARWHGELPSGSDLDQDTLRALVLSNSRIALLALVEAALGNSFDASSLRWFCRTRQESLTPEIHAQLATVFWKTDVRDLLSKVSVPTLVAHYRNNRFVTFEGGREVAAGIPGARFVPLEGNSHFFFFSDTRPLRCAIAEFLGDPIGEVERPSTDAAKALSAPESVQGVFRREGEFWTISCWGEVFRLRDVRGLSYIAHLLGHPREELHVLSLASNSGGSQGELAETGAEAQVAQSDLTVGVWAMPGRCWTLRLRRPTGSEPQSYASSLRKLASSSSLSV